MKKNSDSYHHGDLKNALINAGLEILKDKGIEKLSLRAVARKAGVSHSAPYSHFSDKNELLSSIAEEGFKQLEELYQKLTSNFNGDYKTLFFEFSLLYVKFAISNSDTYLLMFSGIIGNQYNEKQECNYENCSLYLKSMEAFNVIVSLIKRGQTENYIKNDDPFILAIHVWTTLHGLAILLINNTIPSPQNFTFSEENMKNLPNILTEMICNNIFEGIKLQ